MGNSKIIFGNETLMDLTGDTVNANNLLAGETAHDMSGNQVQGNVTVPDELNDLTDVTITTPTDGDLLQYDGANSKFVNSHAVTDNLAAVEENGAYNRAPVNIASQVIGGMTLTANENKTVTFAGSNTSGSTQVAFLTGYFTLPAGDYTVTTINATGGFATNFQIYGTTTYLTGPSYYNPTVSLSLNAETTIRWRMVFPNGANVDGITIKPMIYDARLVNPPYQPFTMTNRELTDKVQGIISAATNAADFAAFKTAIAAL